MNRAERRAKKSATGVIVVRGGRGGLSGHLDFRDEQREAGLEVFGYSKPKPAKPAKDVKPVKEANQRSRGSTGRFAGPQGAAGVQVALPPALTRQERRAQKRLANKLAGGWGKVTGGEGVVLVDGKPVG